MSDAYVVQVGGHTAGIVVRDTAADTFSFFAATHRFNALEGRQFPAPHAAERAALALIAPRRLDPDEPCDPNGYQPRDIVRFSNP